MQDVGFLHQALVYLAAGVIMVPVFRRLGLGSVLGYLAAGIAIGPWGLRLVAAPEAILHFAEIGVVMLLFLVGLELNPRRLWQLRRPILGMGAAQVLVTALAVAALGWALGLPWLLALVVGMGFAMSSTAIGLATLEEKRLLRSPGGQASFSVLLFQDVAVIPLLLVLNFISIDEKASLDWLAPVKAVGVIVAIIAGGRLLLRPLLRYIANTGLREIFVGFALLLVIGIAALMQAIGLSMALGAFLAGVLLADSEYRHALELDIEPFKGLLLGLFFIAVGMSIDLRVVAREAEVGVGDGDVEVLGDLAAPEHGADGLTDLVGAPERLAGAPDARLDPAQLPLGGIQQFGPLAGALGAERRVAADDQPFAGIVRTFDLGQIALVEQRGLQGSVLGRQLLDRRRPQRGQPVQSGRCKLLGDARAGDQAAVADQNHAAEPEAPLQLVDLRRERRRIAGVALEHLDRDRTAPGRA